MPRIKIHIDRDLCQGHSVCLAECPEVFDVIENSDSPYPQVALKSETPNIELLEKIERAANFCPNGVIRVEVVTTE